MSCIHYKFRNNSKHDTIQFDGSYITVGEIKQAILGQKKMGRAPDFTLQIINAQNQEIYKDDNQLIPRNADVIVKRVPTGNKVSKAQLAAQSTSIDMYKMSATPMPLTTMEKTDLSKSEGTEEDKLKAMMMQQAMAYDNPTLNKRYSRADEEIPLNYICHRCNKPGHLIKNCPTNGNPAFEHRPPPGTRKMMLSLKKETSKKPELTDEEKRQMEVTQRSTQDKVRSLAEEAYTNIPTEMKCPLCKQLMVDACLSVCCGQSFCDECIREKILDEAICPACGDEVYPDKLISNNALRVTINKYKKDNQDQIAKLYSDCHIKPKSRDSTPKPEDIPRVTATIPPSSLSFAPPSSSPAVPSLVSSASVTSTAVVVTSSSGLVDATSALAITDVKPELLANVGMLVEPPPPVAILPLKEETKSTEPSLPDQIEVTKEIKPPVSAILPQIPNYSSTTYSSTILPLPSLPIIPYNPVLPAPVGILPASMATGLLPPPLPLPESRPRSRDGSSDRILDPNEFYTIQSELRRLQERRRTRSPVRRRHSSVSPPSRRRHSPKHRKHGLKRRQGSGDRVRLQGIHRTARYPDRRKHARPIRDPFKHRIRMRNGRSPSPDSHSEERIESRDSDVSGERSRDNSPPRSLDKKRSKDLEKKEEKIEANGFENGGSPKHRKKDKEHKKKKHKKDKKEKRKKKEKVEEEEEGTLTTKQSLTEYSPTDQSSLDRSPSPYKPIITRRQASPSPDRSPIPPTQPSPPASPHHDSLMETVDVTPAIDTPCSEERAKSALSRDTPLPSRDTPSQETPASSPHELSPLSVHTPPPCGSPPGLARTPTATGGVTPQFHTAEDDAVSIKMNNSDREVNGGNSSSDDGDSSDTSASGNLEALRKQYKEAALQIKQLKEQKIAEKKKQKKKKKKKKKRVKDEEEEKKKKKKKHKREKEELEEGEIKAKATKKRKRTASGSQESLDSELKQKNKKSKNSKKSKVDHSTSKGIGIKVNFTPTKNSNSKTISITSPAKADISRKVQINVATPTKPIKIRNRLLQEESPVPQSKKTKSHKKSRHKISKDAVSGIQDDPEYL